jgi:competence protein ComEC
MLGQRVPSGGGNKFEGDAERCSPLGTAPPGQGAVSMPSPATHLRAPLLWVLAPLMAGIAAARVWDVPPSGLASLALGAALAGAAALGAAVAPGRWTMPAWALCLAISASLGGFVLLHIEQPAGSPDPSRPPREVTVTMEVQHVYPPAPEARQFTGLGRITAVTELDAELAGRPVYFSAIRRISVPPQRSGRYVIRGVVEPLAPGDGADAGFNEYLANLGIHHRLIRAQVVSLAAPPGAFQAFCARARIRLESILRRGLPEKSPAASLYLAMLLGEKAVLTVDQENAFMRSGTFHIFSISGLHVGIIALALLVSGNLLRLPHRGATVAGLLVLWLYVQITGASPPAMRAFLMIAFLTVSRAFRLPGNPLAALAAAAIGTLLLDPWQLFSTGFQMSYAVVVALVTMGQPLSDRWLIAWKPYSLLPRNDWRWHHYRVERSGRKVIASFAICWTAFLASVPSGIGYFELFTPGSLVANLIIIPLCFLIMWAGFISLIAGLAWLWPVSAAANLIAALLVAVMDWLLRHGTALPAAWFPARYRAEWLAPASMVFMTAVFLVGAASRWSPRLGGYWLPVVALGLLLLFGVKFG